MPYYRMPQGDPGQRMMSRGDPGFLSILGRIGKAAAGFIPGAGPMAKAGIGILGRIGTVFAPRGPGGVLAKAGGQVITAGGRILKTGRGAAAAGAAGGIAAVLAGQEVFRPGAPGRAGRRRRRMHVTNIKALRRSVRRLHGFAKVARKVLRFVSPKPPRGRPLFKKKRASARM